MCETEIKQIEDTWCLFENLLYEDCLQLPPNGYLDENFKRISYFPDYIEKKLENFQNLLKIPSYKDIVKNMNIVKISKLIERINESIKNFFLGNTIKANKYANEAINLCKENLNNLTPWDFTIPFPYIENFYRIRATTDFFGDIQKPTDLFHCPFEKRYQLKPQRYSVPGIPCLYLGSSAYICWVELDRPNLNHIAITRYVTGPDEFNLIDLSWRPMQFCLFLKLCRKERFFEFNYEKIKDHTDEYRRMNQVVKNLYAYIHTWPLLLLCSIPCPKGSTEDYFKPEYLFPQLLIQWISNQEDKFHGIKYFSVKRTFLNKKDYDQYAYVGDILSCNIAIPVTCSQQEGYDSELLKRFSIRKPISYQDYQIKIDARNSYGYNYWKNDHDVKLEQSYRKYRYGDLLFGKLEKILHLPLTDASDFIKREKIFFLYGDDFPAPKWKLIDYFSKFGFDFLEHRRDKEVISWDYFITMNPQNRDYYPFKLLEKTKITSLEGFLISANLRKPEFLE